MLITELTYPQLINSSYTHNTIISGFGGAGSAAVRVDAMLRILATELSEHQYVYCYLYGDGNGAEVPRN